MLKNVGRFATPVVKVICETVEWIKLTGIHHKHGCKLLDRLHRCPFIDRILTEKQMWILCSKYEKQSGLKQSYLKHHEQIWPEVPSLHFIEFLWCSSRQVFRKEPNGNSYHKLAQYAIKMSRDLILQDHARKPTTNQTKSFFYIEF